MKKTLCSIAALTAMLSFADASMAAKEVHPSCGPPGTWCSLGHVTADRSRDHDTIVIKGSDDEFRARKFKVKDSPIDIHRMVVTYDSGAREATQPCRD